MSVDGRVDFHYKDNLDFLITKYDDWRRKVKAPLGYKILSYDVQPRSDRAPFGEVKTGFIKIQGRLIQTRI
jgi:hypothetical protein